MISWLNAGKLIAITAAAGFCIWLAADVYARAKKAEVLAEVLQRERAEAAEQKKRLAEMEALNQRLYAEWLTVVAEANSSADAQEAKLNELLKKTGNNRCLDVAVVRVLNGSQSE